MKIKTLVPCNNIPSTHVLEVCQQIPIISPVIAKKHLCTPLAFTERYMEQLETYAMTAVPAELGDKILHVIQQNRTALFSSTEYAKPEKLPPIPPGLPPLPKLQFPTQNITNNNSTIR